MDCQYEHLYKREAKFVVINDNDPDLYPVKIPLMSVELYYDDTYENVKHRIDGYGLAPEDQVFEFQTIPDKVKIIEGIVRKKRGIKPKNSVPLEFLFEEMDAEPALYKDEILWIKKQIYRHYYGYFFFNNGQLTYIEGCHYTYLNFWPINNRKKKNGLAEYRDRDRRWFMAVMYTWRNKIALFRYRLTYTDTNGKTHEPRYFNMAVTLDEYIRNNRHKIREYIIEDAQAQNPTEKNANQKKFFEVDLKRRVFYGIIYPKHRREGATSRAGFMNWYVVATLGVGGKGGIQSLSDRHAAVVFVDHIAKRLRKMPFFFRLMTDGPPVPKTEINFSFPSTQAGEVLLEKGLIPHEGSIIYTASGERALDSEKLDCAHHDEIGKIDPKGGISIDIIARWFVVMRTLAQGGEIHGLALLTSTLGEMSKGGGDNMKRLVRMSMPEDSNDNGNTRSGLLTVFFHAADGLDGYVDKHGMSIIDDPEEPVLNCDGQWVMIGAMTFLKNRRAAFEADNDEVGLIDEIQNFPLCLKEAWYKSAKNSVMPILRMRKRMNDLDFMPHIIRKYNLEWANNQRHTTVVMNEHEDGKFWFSDIPQEQYRNRVTWNPELQAFEPSWEVRNRGVIGADPAKHNKEEVAGKMKSFHAGSAFRKRDKQFDTDDKPKSEWVGNRFVGTYKNRDVSRQVYDEDMLKWCWLTGFWLYPETNVDHLWRYFVENKCSGFLLYDTDGDGSRKPIPGAYTGDGNINSVKEDLFDCIEVYTNEMADFENHGEILSECCDIEDKSEMTYYDLFTASCFALRGARSIYPNIAEEMEKPFQFEFNIIEEYLY